MTDFLKFIIIFITSGFLDACWTLSILYTEKRKPFLASIWTGIAGILMAFNIVSYVENKWLIIASVLGASLGCFMTIKYFKE